MESLKGSFLGRTHQRQTKAKLAKPYHVQDSTSRLSVIVFLHINLFQQHWGTDPAARHQTQTACKAGQRYP